MPGEFELISRHFKTPLRQTELGVGDDAALIAPRPGMRLAVSTDMLVSGTHFLAETDPFLLGWKTAAVNISDLAAMAAAPRWITLALSLPSADEAWVAALAKGFHACCETFGLDWIGGDTTRGPLNLCATVFGEVPPGEAILRSGAKPGDEIWVSGEPGLAALGLAHLLEEIVLDAPWRELCLGRLHKPEPRVALGLGFRGIASAMLDVSDGLLGDLGHILEASQVGAIIEEALLGGFSVFEAACDAGRARRALFVGGDDYELLFAAPPAEAGRIAACAVQTGVPVRRIGRLTPEPGLWLEAVKDGGLSPLAARGFDHFG